MATPSGHLDLLLFGTAASVVFSLVAQIGEQVDFLRFLPRDRRTSRTSWWIALLSAGPGWIIFGALKLLLGSFLAYFALSHGVSSEHAAEPAHMYLEAFRYVLSQPDLVLALTGTFVILSQVKINVTNAYAGSIAWSNFFSRLTHSHPGRVVWLVFNVMVALLLMEIGVYKALEQTLALYSNVAIAWVGALVADLVINKPLGLRPQHIEFKRAHLYDINPVGVGAMTIATIVSISRVLRPVRTDGEGALGLRGAGGRLRHRAPDRVGDRRQILHRAQAQTKLAESRIDPVLYLRAFVRAGGHGLLPRLCRADLLAVLFARRPLPRPLQAARTNWRAGLGDAGQAVAGADLRPDQLAVRALSRGVRGIRWPRWADARADLSADVGDDCGRQSFRCPTCCGRCSSRSPSSSAWWRGCSCWRNKAAARRRRKRGGRPRS